MTRKSFSRTERLRRFELHGGICHICKHKIQVGEKWELEHVKPVAFERDDEDINSDENVKPAHVKCHKRKTAVDKADIAKADRIRAKHIGAWPKSRARIQSRPFAKTRHF